MKDRFIHILASVAGTFTLGGILAGGILTFSGAVWYIRQSWSGRYKYARHGSVTTSGVHAGVHADACLVSILDVGRIR